MPPYKLRIVILALSWQVWCWLVCSSRALGEGADAVAGNRLRVMTYNVQFLPDPVSIRNERLNPAYRSVRIAEEASKFDIVGLQETFHETHRNNIIRRLADLWGQRPQAVQSPTPEGFFTSGGCLLLSQRPMIENSATVFSNFSKPADYGFRADGFAAKGVIHARIARRGELEEDFLDVFVSHLEARAGHLRPLQHQELGEFVKQQSDPASPVLILGDLNTRGEEPFPQDPNSQYSALMQCLRAARPDNEVIDVWPTLKGSERGGTTEQESHEIGKRIDYIIICNPPDPGTQLKPVTVEVKLFRDPKVVALSDHNAVIAELEWPPRVIGNFCRQPGE